MFKLESYIAPILLSYVDKYIKNFRLEDSQVSLWGGDASFHNLDLRLEVLEEELQLPFSFISGHIRELSIHVPWTKLTSEPITITINTIECVLKLKDANDRPVSESSPSKEKHKKHTNQKHEVEAPPNYVQLLINKIVNNIKILCNNLILKYVEEDIVLSMNVKHLKVESCNEKWTSAYTDISPTQVVMRKLISVNDLTVCLDKRNASGKIDFYQEPMLYRCSMAMYLLRTYHSSTSNKTSLTRLDIYCNNMEFSVTEQQVPMFIRLIVLLQALPQKQLKSPNDTQDTSSGSLENKDNGNNSETWTGWAWSYVSSVFPTQWDDDLENQQLLNQSGHIVQVGFYVDNASLTFKVSETSSDKGYYNQKKIRYYPLLTLQLQGIYSEMISVGRKWSNLNSGISEILLLPLGPCSCGHGETSDFPYLVVGSKSSNYIANSLFDANAIENTGQGKFRNYNTDWDYHIFTNTDDVLLERSPAFGCDYVYQIEIPEDSSSDILSETGSNLEYSNLVEKGMVRMYLAPLKFRVCSGFFHRTSSLQVAAAAYDYPPYYIPKSEPLLQELLPPSEEDFDALNEFIPTKILRIRLIRPVIEIHFMDHSYFEPAKGNLFKRAKKQSTANLLTIQPQSLPILTIECKLIAISIVNPMYTNRLVHTTCQLPEPPVKMFEACFIQQQIDIVGLCSRLLLKKNKTTIIVPFNLIYESKSILSPQYWMNPDVIHTEINFHSENLTFNCTKAKLIVVSHLIDNVLKRNTDGLKNLKYTSLLYDASRDYTMPYLELYMEGLKFHYIQTNSTVSMDLTFDSIKAFIFDSTDSAASGQQNNIQQVLFLSGPEPKIVGSKNYYQDSPLFSATIQYPLKPAKQAHPALVVFNLQEINVCADPLVCKWLLYQPIEIGFRKSEDRLYLSKCSDLFVDTPRRSCSQLESVHSSSDRDLFYVSHKKMPPIEEEESIDVQERIYNFLKNWHPVWKCMLLNGHISQCVIYFPMASISAVGTQGVKEAVRDALNKKLVPNVMVITLPFANIHSAQKTSIDKYLKKLPAKLPASIWTMDKSSFPWTMSISDLNCYSLEHGKEIDFLKSVGISATIGLSTKNATDTNISELPGNIENTSMGSLGVYVHIDVTPIVISVSETQMYLLASLMYGLTEFFTSLTPKKSSKEPQKTESAPSIATVVSPSLSPTAKDNTFDNTSETIAATDTAEESANSENVKLTAWIQWTITKLSIEFLCHTSPTSQLKLVIDVEDIVSSLDYQNVYLKMKSKIGSIAIQHYRRISEGAKWERGNFSGVVMRLREDIPLEKKPEESGFIGITVTRASSHHTHNLWGALQRTKEKRTTTSRYITEIVISVQPIDFVVSPKTLLGFYPIVSPFLDGFGQRDTEVTVTKTKPWFTNQNLPLAYLDCHEVRIILPTVEFVGNETNHDVMVVQITKITITPSVVNPICRTPIRPDIYRQAAQARVLTIPGSELEDRQYQLDVDGMSINTTTWLNLDQVLNIRGRGVNENPALVWNNLEQGKLSITPILNMRQITEKFAINVVAAPMMIYKNETIICSNSFEINFVSDISIFLALDQIKLVFALLNELQYRPAETQRPPIIYPFTRFDLISDDLEAELTEFYKDSGIDTSEIRSVLSTRSQTLQAKPTVKVPRKNQVYYEVPLEVLFTAGRISCCLYNVYLTQSVRAGGHRGKKKKHLVNEEDRNYEASEEESVDEKMRNQKKYQPLLYFFISQPNVYTSNQQFLTTTQISCFDCGIKMSDTKSVAVLALPTMQDFPIDLIVTRSGTPDLITGIPPAFFTLKHTKEQGKSTGFHIEISRPTKFACSIAKITALMILKNKILECFPSESEPLVESQISTFSRVKEAFQGIDAIHFKTDQIVLIVESDNNLEAHLSVGKSKSRLYLYERPEKIHNLTTLECVTFSVVSNENRRLLLNPWTVSVEIGAMLESWQTGDSTPQIHLAFDSECVMLDISPEHILCLEKIVKELSEFSAYFTSETQEELQIHPSPLPDKDQHYKDDLRAGAFQFIEAANSSGEELPLPYQVMFWNGKDTNAMAWRYPQPRALTKVRIFPVPLETTSETEWVNVKCDLQYWSDYHSAYVPYVQFYLSESEVCYLNLPKSEPLRAVACIWRVLLTTIDKNGIQIGVNPISPRALAACMRIDSYFNKCLIPSLTAVLYVSKLEVSLFSSFNKLNFTILPVNLRDFTPDRAFPDSHCFLKLSWAKFKAHMAKWDTNNALFMDLSCGMKCTVLDYTFLTEEMLIDQFSMKFEVNLSTKLSCSCVVNPIQMLFGPSIAHTLSVNSQLWAQNLKSVEFGEFVIFTRYVISNDTNINLRFGQVSTDEDILLQSRCFHLYCWRSSKYKRKLKVAFEDNGWVWCKPFRIDIEGIFVVPLENNLNVIVTVTALSTSQKQIVIRGQFVIANMLLEHFEFKIVPESKDEKEIKKSTVQVLGGKTITPSMFIDSNTNYYFRLRFFGLEAAWTGDIPLKEHTKGAQPWLVKVPLQEKGQFLSIWCRIVVQECQKAKRILAMLWPLFMVKSNLPVFSNIHIETPTLNVHLDSVVKGKGELQQLYCPGTIDHSHQLTFKLGDGTSISDPYIPLNYSLVDQQKFFKKSERENVDEIVESLRSFDETNWPYFGEDLDNVEWIVDEQPQTTIQVKYHNACPYSSALSVELLPWCLMVNTFGCPVAIIMNGTELCRISQYGIVAPPKLDDNFHLGIELGNGWSYSPPLQLSTSDWSQTFYMPKIAGTLPLEGIIKTSVKCGKDLSILSLSSIPSGEIRLLKISSSHIFTNYINSQIQVVCLAVSDPDSVYEFPTNVEKISFSVAPKLAKMNAGMPIIRWCSLDTDNDNNNTNYTFYMAFCFKHEYGWSKPVRVDDNISRRSLTVTSSERQSVPLVLTSEERKGQIFLSLYHDDCPQTLIENLSPVTLYCGQGVNDASGVVYECLNFNYFTKIENGTCVYYTMPFVSEKFPELPQTSFSEKIAFAIEPKIEEAFDWSTAVSITSDCEQFVKIPKFGDVKLVVKVTTYTTLLTIQSVSDFEINAIDIRGRLSRHEMGKNIQEENFVINPESVKTQPVLDKLTLYKSLFVPTIPTQSHVELNVFIKSFKVGFLADDPTSDDLTKQGVASFCFDHIGVELEQCEILNLTISMADLQFDNELYSSESFDFPVVLVSQDNKVNNNNTVNILDKLAKELISNSKGEALFLLDLIMESWIDKSQRKTATGAKQIKIKINPLSFYIEDLYINKLVSYFNGLFPRRLTIQSLFQIKVKNSKAGLVCVPEVIFWNSTLLAKPVKLKSITIEPLSLLLSVHCSVKMYIALDQSPLQFGRFERRRLLTTPYRLGHAMTMHYLSGAIFGAGWVVSSLELLGSPSGLARAMGTGLRDFVSLPYRGLVQGPWAFLTGVTHGASSLIKHVTAGTLQSVTKLASSVARNLDRLSLDEEHLKRTEDQRRQKPQGLTQGFMLGLTGLGISLLGAVGGIAHHPLQSIMADGASPRSLAAGVGLGLVGVVTKPLSGAAELVALTGQGLLQGAGWNTLPQPRMSLLQNISSQTCTNSNLKYEWKVLQAITCRNVLYITEATIIHNSDFKGVALILTNEGLVIVNIDSDVIERIVSLSQLQVVPSTSDPTLLVFKISKKLKEESVIEMDPACRARVADYVRSTTKLLQLASQEHSELSVTNLQDEHNEQLNCYVNPQNRNYFICLFTLAKHKNNTYNFPVL